MKNIIVALIILIIIILVLAVLIIKDDKVDNNSSNTATPQASISPNSDPITIVDGKLYVQEKARDKIYIFQKETDTVNDIVGRWNSPSPSSSPSSPSPSPSQSLYIVFNSDGTGFISDGKKSVNMLYNFNISTKKGDIRKV